MLSYYVFFTFLVPCNAVLYDSHLKTSSLPVVCRRVHVTQGCPIHMCVVFLFSFLFILCSLCCGFLWIVHFIIAPSVFSNIYLQHAYHQFQILFYGRSDFFQFQIFFYGRSEFFREMLIDKGEEQPPAFGDYSPCIRLENISADVFLQIVNYVYQDKYDASILLQN